MKLVCLRVSFIFSALQAGVFFKKINNSKKNNISVVGGWHLTYNINLHDNFITLICL